MMPPREGPPMQRHSRLSRRAFAVGATMTGLGLLAGCGSPFPQPQTRRTPRLGFIALFPQPYDDAFFQRLRELGYLEGENLTVDRRYGDGPDQLHDLAAELVRLGPDVLVAIGTPAISAAQQATKEIPIVMPFSGDPVGQGYAASLSRPGGNITGLTTLSSSAIIGKRLQLITEAAPGTARVAVLWNPANSAKVLERGEMEVAARTLGVRLDDWEVRSGEEFPAAFASIARQHPDALVVLQEPLTGAYRAGIADFALQTGLVSISELKEFALAGLLMSYGPDSLDLSRRAATYVDKILKGAKPADLPIEQPMTFQFVVNLKTAAALGITLPEEIMLQVTEAIQ
jgi:putative tryptophan/tyrosine transport system substrate-binding protein